MVIPTYPEHWLDRAFWPLLATTWERLSRKNAHWWHYSTALVPNETQTTIIPADPIALNKYRTIGHLFLGTNLLDQNVVELAPREYGGKFQIGYYTWVNGKLISQTFSLVLQGNFGLLQTSHPFRIYAYTYPEREPLALDKVGFTTRWKLNPKLPLL